MAGKYTSEASSNHRAAGSLFWMKKQVAQSNCASPNAIAQAIRNMPAGCDKKGTRLTGTSTSAATIACAPAR